MRRLLFTLLLLAAPLALAATVYKWVDENGVVHYSDQPHPNAEKVHVKEPQTYRESNPLAAPAAPSPDGGGGGGPTYRGCSIAQPADNEDLANPDSLVVVVRTDPPLRPGDQVFVTLDGQALNDGRPTGAQFTISPVERGTHVLQATVRDSGGALLCQTSGVSYSVHQPSVLNPANPVRPR
ncbi:MAG: DUF4124 domain-containing protein [Steroidobacterales bacterium]|jgi:hypothetical protein